MDVVLLRGHGARADMMHGAAPAAEAVFDQLLHDLLQDGDGGEALP